MQLDDRTWEVQGRSVTTPVRIGAASAALAVFGAPAAAVRRLLPARLEPVAVAGRSPVTLLLVRYRENDLGVYDELGVVLAVRGPGDARPGLYIHDLPVTADFTLHAGRALWGLPKWRGTLRLSIGAGAAACALDDGDRPVLAVRVRAASPPLPALRATIASWSVRDGTLLRTPMRFRARGLRAAPAGAALRLGDHRLADDLRVLGLPRRALLSGTVDHLSFTLDNGTPIPERAPS